MDFLKSFGFSPGCNAHHYNPAESFFFAQSLRSTAQLFQKFSSRFLARLHAMSHRSSSPWLMCFNFLFSTHSKPPHFPQVQVLSRITVILQSAGKLRMILTVLHVYPCRQFFRHRALKSALHVKWY